MIVSLEGLKKTASSLLNVRKAYVRVCKMTNQRLNRRNHATNQLLRYLKSANSQKYSLNRANLCVRS